MRRIAVLFALAACSEAEPKQPAPRNWVVPPASAAVPLGAPAKTIGRSQAPQAVVALGIEAAANAGALAPLRSPTPWTVPGDGPARAVIYGLVGTNHAVELIDVDTGQLKWRDTTACGAPVVGVTAEAVVCADAKGVRAIAIIDGKQKWKSDASFIAITDDRVVTAGAGESVILDASDGGELARVKLPGSVDSSEVIASCGDAGRELFAYSRDGRLVHVVEAKGGPTIQWSVSVPFLYVPDAAPFEWLDPCAGNAILVRKAMEFSPSASVTLMSIDRSSGDVTGTVDRLKGFWPARDGSGRLEVSTDAGVFLRARDLRGPSEAVGLPPLGELVSQRGDMRLVRATPQTAVLLDRKGVRAYLPLAQLGAVVGETSIIAGSWIGSPGETVRRVRIPDGRYRRHLRLPLIGPGLGVTAELRDLPEMTQLDVSGAVAKLDAGKAAVGSVALDPTDAAVYATALEKEPDDTASAGVARFDLKTKAWSWYRADGCGPGTPVGLAASTKLVACAARGSNGGSVHATTRDGQPMWTWTGATAATAPTGASGANGATSATGVNVDGVDAVGELVLVRDASRVHLLDAADGHLLGDFESDDGGAMPAAILDVAGMQMLVTAQHGRVVAWLPRARMLPAWSLVVAGVVKSIEPAGAGVLVDLEDGDAYRVDARTGAASGIAGIGLVWHSAGDVLAGEAPGGVIPPAVMPGSAPAEPEAPKKKTRKKPKKTEPAPDDDFDEALGPPPRLNRDVWPDPGPLPASWQLTLYELSGAYRTRNDYALDAPITPAVARSAKAPLAVQSGPGYRSVLVVEPERGDPVRRVFLPEDAAPGTAFSTVVDGKPVVGVLLANPLRVVVF